MAHPLPRTESPALPLEGAHAAAHLASIRQALRAADLMAGKTSAELTESLDVTQVWPELPPLHRDVFARRSQRVADRAIGGLELLMTTPNPAAAERLSDDLRAGLAEVEALFRRR
ncbi:hypothetical protein OMW55_01385 [Sphingomonas sp. BN140010]|uniref:Uncharacterized protein n=1 Tax=Sphingomonas arvum TaxID=2992113 RepID=A0ABT3JBL8_9SPHN|nr:hypothetical protein [Sphingomonas sp. BN140010]MCW3796463.1 hypothetical protein [Sphingomonas sp. BN140010]